MGKMMKHKKMIGIVLTMVLLGMGFFTVKPSATNTPSGTDITYCVSSDEGRLLLNWTLKNVDGYELNLAQNKEFTKNPQTFTYNGSSRKASLTDLPSVTYYVRVRTFIKNGGEKLYSDWSNVSTINIHKHYYTRTISKYPTCTENGTYSYKCSCGRYFKMPISKFGHNFEYVSDENSDKCGEYKCSRCGLVQKSVDHDYKLTKTVSATCQEDGYKEYTCQNCNHVKTEKTSNKIDHEYRLVKETNEEKTYECVYCHDSYTEKMKEETTETKPTEDKNTEETTEDKEYVIDLGNGETTTVTGHYERQMAEEIFEQLNAYRVENGMSKLANGSSKLQEAADIRAYEIANTFEHYRPNGERALISFRNTTSCCAENIAKYQRSATEVMTDWKNSPGHNSNMISKYPKSVSISVFAEKYLNKNGDVKYRYHFVQFFGW